MFPWSWAPGLQKHTFLNSLLCSQKNLYRCQVRRSRVRGRESRERAGLYGLLLVPWELLKNIQVIF